MSGRATAPPPVSVPALFSASKASSNPGLGSRLSGQTSVLHRSSRESSARRRERWVAEREAHEPLIGLGGLPFRDSSERLGQPICVTPLCQRA